MLRTAPFAALLLAAAPALAAEPETCATVRLAEVGWTDIAATTGVAVTLLQALGYETETELLALPVTFQSLARGDVDVFLGQWMPTMETLIRPFLESGEIDVVRVNLEGAKYTLATTTTLADQGLTDFADIAKFKDQLDGKIYGIEPGNDGNKIIADMIAQNAFGLGDFKLVESSEQAMLAQAERAVGDKEGIVFLGWEPHPMNMKLPMTYLAGGDAWFGPGFGGSTVSTAVRAGYVDECPNVGRLLQNLAFTLPMENEIMGAILDLNEKPEAAAANWISAHPIVIDPWLAGVTARDGGPADAAVRAAMGL